MVLTRLSPMTVFQRSFIAVLAIVFAWSTAAQEPVLIVDRCKALSQTSPVRNVWVDPENIKWVANGEGLFKVMALDLVQKESLPAGMTSLLTLRGGNADIRWNTAEMETILRGATLSTASYDPKTKSLWVGTLEDGVYQLSLSPLAIIQQLNARNKRLASNQVNDIHISNAGTVWIATIDGMVTGSGDKWTIQERYLNFIAVDTYGDNLWILGDNFLWQVDSKGKWLPVAIEPRNVEGTLRDIAVDSRGRVWIASNIMTGYNAETKVYQRFGPGQYFTSQFVTCLDVDRDGSIWTGTDDKGLYLIQWEDAMTVNVLMSTPPDCNSQKPSAALSVRITGGQPPRTITWSNGQSGETISGLIPGEYAVTVTDGKGIRKTSAYKVPPAGVTARTEGIVASTGGNDGQATLITEGGTGKISFAWDNGEHTPLATQLSPGLHSVTVSDEKGCTTVVRVDVPETIPTLDVTIDQSTIRQLCNGNLDVTLTAKPKGGKSPYTYTWASSLGSGETARPTKPGLYTVTVTDKAGQTTSASADLKAGPILSVSASTSKPAMANVPDGAAVATAAGGQPPYTFAWSNGNTGAQANALRAGTYTVTVTDANTCTAETAVLIPETITALAATLRQTTEIACYDGASARLEVNVQGGKEPYRYAWNSGGTDAAADNLKAGSYSVTVTDAAGNTKLVQMSVSQPKPIDLIVTAESAASTKGSDGKASVKASGGSGKFSYSWDNGETTARAVKLSGGAHQVTVTDDKGCPQTAAITIPENILSLSVIIRQTAPVRCAGGSDAAAAAIPSGGKEPYTFQWSNGLRAPDIDRLGAGNYSVTVTDATGVTATTTVTIAGPDPLTADVRIAAATSNTGAIGKAVVIAKGGTGKYSYTWEDGKVSDKEIELPGGSHTVTVSDENGCTATASFFLENIPALNVSIAQSTAISCAGGKDATLQAVISGGKSPFTYAWSTGLKTEILAGVGPGTYSVTVTDGRSQSSAASFTVKAPAALTVAIDIGESINARERKAMAIAKGGTGTYSFTWSSGETIETIAARGGENYSVTVTDQNGCTTTASAIMPKNAEPLTVKIVQTQPVKCADGSTASLKATISGGKAPYTCTWSGPSTGTGDVLSNVGRGNYSCTATDSQGEKTSASIDVTAPAPLTIAVQEVTPASPGSADGRVTITIAGGTPPYAHDGKPVSLNAAHMLSRLPPGKNLVRIKDANGCEATKEITITEEIAPLSVTIQQSQVIKCAGQAEAALEAMPRGGKAPYQYAWSTGASTALISGLNAGQFTITITDAAGQSSTVNFKVSEPEGLRIIVNNIRPATNDRIKDGKAMVEARGGFGTYRIAWSSGETSINATRLPLGAGKVTVTDENGCTAEAIFTIPQKVMPELTPDRLASGEPIRMEKIQFEADSINLNEEAIPSLDELFGFLYDNPTLAIEVSGHTNSLPADDYCDKISTARATTVANYLIKKGIDTRRIVAKGYGKRKPIATNQTPEGRRRNQRVEIRLIQISD